MNWILLSGGSGKRLWPLSNSVRSKQFLKVFIKEDGLHESMLQRMYRMIKKVDSSSVITIASLESQVSQIKSQLEDKVEICVEPERRDTFPAIALSATFLKEKGLKIDEPVIVCPIDPYVEEDYFKYLKKLSEEVVNEKSANIFLMGIKPSYPYEKYGYILPDSIAPISTVKEFKEKPDKVTAQKYITAGALWNSGVFVFKLSYLLSIIRKNFGTDDYYKLYSIYNSLPKISFDYAVVEKEKSTKVVRFDGLWKDLGTWDTLTSVMSNQVSGNVIAQNCENTHIINELNIPLIALEIKDTIIASTPDGIIVSKKECSERIKDYVPSSRPMYECRKWGEYKVLDYTLKQNGNNSLVKELIINSDEHISYQSHRHRMEVWVLTEGAGIIIVDSEKKRVKRGDVVIIKPGMKHSIIALSKIHIVEIQIGDKLIEDDIERFNWDFTC